MFYIDYALAHYREPDREMPLADAVAADYAPYKGLQESAIEVKIAFPGAVTRWHITCPNAQAHNTPGQPRVADITKTDNLAANAPLAVPALSCALFAIPLP